jgi:hypothetical protein
MAKTLTTMAALLARTAALAQPLPQPKVGTCPSAYHACKLGLEGIVSKRKNSPYRSGRSPDWLKMKNPACAAVKREPEEDWAG